MGGEIVRSPYEAALAASLVAGLTVGATIAATALITAQAMGVPPRSGVGHWQQRAPGPSTKCLT